MALLFASWKSDGQSRAEANRRWQQNYKEEFLTDPRSPLTAADTGFLRFFPYDSFWVYRCKVKRVKNSDTVLMATHSGKVKKYVVYAILKFKQSNSLEHYLIMRTNPATKLRLYQSVDLARDSAYRDYLFLPFNDLSNGETTYGGGRYLDFRISDIEKGRLLLDFNKAYNPWCAFKEGYSCPIPPKENQLRWMRVWAGEMLWAKKTTE